MIIKNVDLLSRKEELKSKKPVSFKGKYLEKVKKMIKSKIKDKNNLYSNHWAKSNRYGLHKRQKSLYPGERISLLYKNNSRNHSSNLQLSGLLHKSAALNNSILRMKEVSEDKTYTLSSGSVDLGKKFFKNTVNSSVSKHVQIIVLDEL